jgi:hypothetical protein
MFKKLCVTIFVASGFFTVMDIQADASHRTDAGSVLSPTSLKTVHVSKKYSQATAIAKALAKYPGHKFVSISSTSTVWVVSVKN